MPSYTEHRKALEHLAEMKFYFVTLPLALGMSGVKGCQIYCLLLFIAAAKTGGAMAFR
jgi:hypothetical protein